MKKFFKVQSIDYVLSLASLFKKMDIETIFVRDSLGRVLAENMYSDIDIPGFSRSTMDGFAVKASSSFGASELNPVYLNIVGDVCMGRLPDFTISDGEVAKISTGGALPNGTDSVIMVEYTSYFKNDIIEVYKSVAPGQNIIVAGEDIKRNELSLTKGTRIRPQDMGLMAALGKNCIKVFKKPLVGLISTGNEIVDVDQKLLDGQVRDVNSYTLFGQVVEVGSIPINCGIVSDKREHLFKKSVEALKQFDMVLISGGSSMGTKDLTVDVMESIPNTEILVHGISISPGKPTILARSGGKPIWGLPGHITSAMVVFAIIVKVFLKYMSGMSQSHKKQNINCVSAILSRNVASMQGRTDYIRVRLHKNNDVILADPILGQSGLIKTMVKADGFVKIDFGTEGLESGSIVFVNLF